MRWRMVRCCWMKRHGVTARQNTSQIAGIRAELGKGGGRLFPVAPSLAPDQRIWSNASLFEPDAHDLIGRRTKLPAGRWPNIPDGVRCLRQGIGCLRQRCGRFGLGRGSRDRRRKARERCSRRTEWTGRSRLGWSRAKWLANGRRGLRKRRSPGRRTRRLPCRRLDCGGMRRHTRRSTPAGRIRFTRGARRQRRRFLDWANKRRLARGRAWLWFCGGYFNLRLGVRQIRGPCLRFVRVAVSCLGTGARTFGGDGEAGAAVRANPSQAGKERFDVQLVPVGTIGANSHVVTGDRWYRRVFRTRGTSTSRRRRLDPRRSLPVRRNPFTLLYIRIQSCEVPCSLSADV